MATIQFFKVNTLPGTLVANSLYFVKNGDYSETYITDNAGVAEKIGNSVMITEVAKNIDYGTFA